MADSCRTIVAGPSHPLSWRHAVERRALPMPFENVAFIGGGGLPVWNKTAFDAAVAQTGPADRVVLLTGEVRFGNAILGDKDHATGPLFRDGFTHIARNYMIDAADRLMYLRFRAAIEQWREQFDSRIRFLHWSLLLRPVTEAVNRGRTGPMAASRHPVWNLSDFDPADDPQCFDLRASAAMMPRDLLPLVADADLHPSPVGFDVIAGLVNGAALGAAIAAAMVRAQERTRRWLSMMPRRSEPVLICGDSAFLAQARAILTEAERADLAAAGLHVVSVQTLEGMQAAVAQLGTRDMLFVTGIGLQQADYGDDALGVIPLVFGPFADQIRLRVLPWECLTLEGTSWRGPHYAEARVDFDGRLRHWLRRKVIDGVVLAADPSLLDDPELERCVDIGVVTRPMLRGLYAVLAAAATGTDFSPGTVAAWTDHAIFG